MSIYESGATYDSGAVNSTGFVDDFAFPCNPCSIMSLCGSSSCGTDVSSPRAFTSFMPCLSFSFGPGFNVTGFVGSCCCDCDDDAFDRGIGGNSGKGGGSSLSIGSRMRALLASVDGGRLL